MASGQRYTKKLGTVLEQSAKDTSLPHEKSETAYNKLKQWEICSIVEKARELVSWKTRILILDPPLMAVSCNIFEPRFPLLYSLFIFLALLRYN